MFSSVCKEVPTNNFGGGEEDPCIAGDIGGIDGHHRKG